MSNSEDFQTRYLGKWYSSPYEEMGRVIKIYAEKENKLMMVSGYDMELLIKRFAEGWTLQPPDTQWYSKSLVETLGGGEKR